MPTPKQFDKMARQAAPSPAPAEQDGGWWDSVLNDPRAAGAPRPPVQQLHLTEIPREILRVDCIRRGRSVEIRHANAVLLYGPPAIWKDVGQLGSDDGVEHLDEIANLLGQHGRQDKTL